MAGTCEAGRTGEWKKNSGEMLFRAIPEGDGHHSTFPGRHLEVFTSLPAHAIPMVVCVSRLSSQQLLVAVSSPPLKEDLQIPIQQPTHLCMGRAEGD